MTSNSPNTVFLSFEAVSFLINQTQIQYTVHYNVRLGLKSASELQEFLMTRGVQSLSTLSTETPLAYLLENPGYIIIEKLALIIAYFTLTNLSDFRKNMTRPLFLLFVNRKGKDVRQIIYRSYVNTLLLTIGICIIILLPMLIALVSRLIFVSLAEVVFAGVLTIVISSILSWAYWKSWHWQWNNVLQTNCNKSKGIDHRWTHCNGRPGHQKRKSTTFDGISRHIYHGYSWPDL